jgi:predicted component of type VI protein secretion system
MFRNDGERRSFSLSREMTVIGRRQDCDLMIPLGEISRKHCRIIKDDDGLRLEDLGSSNGTFHNGRRVQEAHLNAGDTIAVGPVKFVVQIDGVPAEDEMQPNAPAEAAILDDDEELETLDDSGGHELDADLEAGGGDLAGDPDELEPISSGDDDDLTTLDEDEDEDESPAPPARARGAKRPAAPDPDDTGAGLEAENQAASSAAPNSSSGSSLDDELEGLIGAPDAHDDDDEPLALDDDETPRKSPTTDDSHLDVLSEDSANGMDIELDDEKPRKK